MYQQQRMDALMDWRNQNRYNHPMQQMQRLREAGLNPNLVYGNGVQTQSANIKTTNSNTPDIRPPQATTDYSGFANSLTAFQDAQVKQINTDNLKKQGELIVAETNSKNVETANKITEGETSKFQLQKSKELKDLVIEEQILRNKKTTAEIGNIDFEQSVKAKQLSMQRFELELKNKEYELRKAKNASEIAKIAEDILRSKIYRETNPKIKEKLDAEIANLIKTGALREIDIKLRGMGLDPSNPEYYKRYTSLLTDLF